MVFPPLPPPRDVTTRLSMILGGLVANVLVRNLYLGPLCTAITGHLCRIGYRFRALAEQVRAGKVPAERPRKPRTATADADTGGERVARPVPEPAVPKLPRRFRWLAALVPATFGYSGQLLHLLDDPEMVALVSASPGLQRLFRSMCRMLGIVDVPELIRLPPRVRRAKARGDDGSVGLADGRGAGFGAPTVAAEDGGLKPALRTTPRSTSRSAGRLGRLPDLGSAAWVEAMRRYERDGFSSA